MSAGHDWVTERKAERWALLARLCVLDKQIAEVERDTGLDEPRPDMAAFAKLVELLWEIAFESPYRNATHADSRNIAAAALAASVTATEGDQ